MTKQPATAALAVAGALAGFIAAEASVRLLGAHPGGREVEPLRVTGAERRLALDLYSVNPGGYFDLDLRDLAVRARYEALGFVGLGKLAQRTPWAVEVRYNSRDFRDVELPPRMPGVRRVLVLGDSFTEGQGVKEPDAYPRVLERELNQTGSARWEVRNCGHRGRDFPRLYQVFETLLEDQPDVIIYGMVLNDPARSEAFRLAHPSPDEWFLSRPIDRPGSTPLFESRLVSLVKGRLERVRLGRETTRWYLDLYGEPNRDGWRETGRLLGLMQRHAQARRVTLILALWPLLLAPLDDGYPFAPPTRAIEEVCRRGGIAFLDLRDALRGPAPETLWATQSDDHPNALAHRLAARALAPVVSRLSAGAITRAPSPAQE